MRSFKVEAEFEHKGLKCVVLGLSMGHRCGYVGVSKSNQLYGVGCSDNCKALSKKDVEGQSIGKRGIIPLMCMDTESETISPEIYFDVHGGLTYSGGGEGCEYPIKSDLWWFGYDCAHYGDGRDLSLMDEEYKKIYGNPVFMDFEPIRTTEYCVEECKRLAEQLSAFDAEAPHV
jgi:hypothetical protein